MAECGAELIIPTNHETHKVTFRCVLPKGHEGDHQERVDWDNPPLTFTMTWNETGGGEGAKLTTPK